MDKHDAAPLEAAVIRTAGPWRLVPARTLAHLHGPSGYIGVSVPYVTAQDKAIAHLLVIAPELLAALRWTHRALSPEHPAAINAASVIAKAPDASDNAAFSGQPEEATNGME